MITANLQRDFRNIYQSGANTQPSYTDIYLDKAGNPKYSLGSCQNNSECNPAGCSSEICSNDPNLVTTCLFRSDYPDKSVYACGCIENTCVWYK